MKELLAIDEWYDGLPGFQAGYWLPGCLRGEVLVKGGFLYYSMYAKYLQETAYKDPNWWV